MDKLDLSTLEILNLFTKYLITATLSNSSNKLETMVEFPLEGFDMSPNMARPVDNNPLSAADQQPATTNGLKVDNS